MLKNIKNFSAFILKAVGGLLIFGGVLTSGFAIAQQNYGFAILIVGFYSTLGGLVYLGGHALVKKGPLLDRKMESETRELRYVTGTLADGETIILAPKQSRWEYPAIFLAMALFSLLLSTIAPRGAAFVMLVITPMIMLSTWLTRYSTEQAMTSRQSRHRENRIHFPDNRANRRTASRKRQCGADLYGAHMWIWPHHLFWDRREETAMAHHCGRHRSQQKN